MPAADQPADDVMTTDLTTFLSMCDTGVPQALEAMFSTVASIDRIGPLRTAYRAGVWTAAATYHRTIVSFLHSPDAKRRRHALRLAINLSELMETGRFSPALDPDLVPELTREAQTLESALNALARRCPLQISANPGDPTANRRRPGDPTPRPSRAPTKEGDSPPRSRPRPRCAGPGR